MRNVRKIEQTNPVLPKRKRVAAYARVSTDTERLSHSLSAQVSYYSDLIQHNPEWEYVGVYADNGITGTKLSGRPEFERLLQDCEAGKIDIILTKSISRFSRNTVDLLAVVRRLKELGIEIRFEKERINSLSGDGEVMLTLLASFAQEEVTSLSNNVKWAARKRMAQGIPNGHFRIFGYRWEGDELVVVPEEAAIVKRIFQNFLDGKSRVETEREFAEEGILSMYGCKWQDSNLKNVLTNITYTGNLLLQKEFIEDPISKRRKKNKGELPQYLVENHHEAIIDPSVFEFVQDEMTRRKELGPLANKSLNISCFTGKLKCSKCGKSYVHTPRKNKSKYSSTYEMGGKYGVWICDSKKGKSSCHMKDIPERILRNVCADVLGIEQFSEDIFSEQIERIDVLEDSVLSFRFVDGHEEQRVWESTAKKDCWGDTQKDLQRAWMRNYMAKGEGRFSVFTTRIKCGCCGASCRRQLRYLKDGVMAYWTCSGGGPQKCGITGIKEPDLKQIFAKLLETEDFDENAFRDQIERITVQPGGQLDVSFINGRVERVEYSTKRTTHSWSEEQRAKMTEVLKNAYPPERRAAMSEKMKQIRKERGANWVRK